MVKAKVWGGCTLLLFVGLGVWGCGPRHRLQATMDKEMEYYAKERYESALRYMAASRFELARQQFAIVEQASVSPGLQELARDGYAKAAAIIEAKR